MKLLKRGVLIVAFGIGAASTSLAGLGVLTMVSQNQPTSLVSDPTDPTRLYSVGRGGQIRTLQNFQYLPPSENFATLPPEWLATGGERAVNSLEFSPKYAEDGLVYISYARAGDNANRIVEFRRSETNPFELDLSTARTILLVPNFGLFHYGGGAKFGPDGYLWVFNGDGDNYQSAQNPNLVNGKILRIDPSMDDFPLDPERNYGIPADNPYVDGAPIATPTEAIHIGVRNPWRWTWDRNEEGGTGGLIFGDVGADNFEEINYAPPGVMGLNFGWSRWEGSYNFAPDTPLAYEPLTDAVLTFPHPDFRAIVGGHVYRGLALGIEMYGRYFFADIISQRVFSCRLTFDDYAQHAVASDVIDHTPELLLYTNPITQVWSIDRDSEGELLLVGPSRIHRIIPDSVVTPHAVTIGVQFNDLANQSAAPRVVNVTIEKLGFSIEFQACPNETGEFTIPVSSGKQTVTVKCGTFLSEKASVDTGTNYSPKIDFSLVNGDTNGDDAIDIGDYAVISGVYGSVSGDGNYARNADLDGNGEVDIADYAIVSSNYGESR